MSITYSSIIKSKDNIKIAESSNFIKYKMWIKNILPEISKGITSDRFELEDNYLTYIKTKEVIFLCISGKKFSTDRPNKFLEVLIARVNKMYENLSIMVEKTKKELSLSEEINIDNIINEFNSGLEKGFDQIEVINTEVGEIKNELKHGINQIVKNLNTLDEALLTSNTLKKNANFFKKQTKEIKNRSYCCCRPWIFWVSITLTTLLTLFIIYVVISVIRCGDLKITCE
jgi:hypothetical protein